MISGARLSAGFVSCCLLLAACGSSDAANAGTSDASVTQVATGPESRQVILDLPLATYGGGEFDPGTVRGKPVILWFWGAF